jgi:hypothetical protein
MKFTAKKIAQKSEEIDTKLSVIKTRRKTKSVNSVNRLEEHLHFLIFTNANSKTGFNNKKGDLLKDVYSNNLDCTVT